MFPCGLFDGDASEFSGGNKKLGIRSSGVAKRQGGGQWDVQCPEVYFITDVGNVSSW